MITSPGGPEVLQLQEVEAPELQEDEVLIKVEGTALNRADTLQRKGLYPPPKGASQYPGLECSGTIDAVGKNVSRWKIGDKVKFIGCFVWLLRKLQVKSLGVLEKLRSRPNSFTLDGGLVRVFFLNGGLYAIGV